MNFAAKSCGTLGDFACHLRRDHGYLSIVQIQVYVVPGVVRFNLNHLEKREPFIIFVGGGRASTPDNPVTTPAKTPSDSDSAPPNPGSSVSPDASGQSAVTSAHSGSVSPYPCLTVKRGKRLVVLQMDYRVVQFVSLCASPFIGELMDPYAVAVLLQNDFVVVDLLSPNYATFENPYPMDIHSSPVTSCLYLVDCPGDLVPAFYPLGTRSSTRSKRAADSDTFSTREWPIIGGECGVSYNPYPELVLTGSVVTFCIYILLSCHITCTNLMP
ncbi:LLGL2 protein [Opisthorchis viverrini]|uniref:LLGL2 protein n=1 Tax=Opisthorchis viverrini TaxID=6198 RepID=A0A1S8XAH2_OPIVI|nr:LLGL2 protein [Opisthorchis viverrini]